MTTSRSGEIKGMHWDELQLFNELTAKQSGYLGIWTRPADRMKTKLEHRVPITLPMYEMLNRFSVRKGLVFSHKTKQRSLT